MAPHIFDGADDATINLLAQEVTDLLILLDAVIGYASAACAGCCDSPSEVGIIDLAGDAWGRIGSITIPCLLVEGEANFILQRADRGRAEHAFTGFLDDVEEGPELQGILYIEQALRWRLRKARH